MSINSRINILVTGVGAIIGQGIVKSLKMSDLNLNIVGLDLNPMAFGAKFCDKFYPKKFNEDNVKYKKFLKNIIEKEKIDIVIPGIEQDVYYFYENKSDNFGAKIVLNSDLTIEVGKSKLKLNEVLVENNIKIIPTTTSQDWKECLKLLGNPPFLLKPDFGSGSRGQAKLYDEYDLDYWVKKANSNYLIQKIIGSPNEEYTVAVFGYGNGLATNPAIFKRKLLNTGATMYAESILSDTIIENTVGKLNKIFLPKGPIDYQFRKENGEIYLLEVNPRISASTSLRAFMGYNEALMCINYYLLNKDISKEKLKAGIANRYIEDSVEFL